MNKKIIKFISLLPVWVYGILLIFIPLVYILFLSFMSNDYYGGINYTFTLKNYFDVMSFTYLRVFLKSFLLAGISTFICICITYPFVIVLSSLRDNIKKLLITLVMIPFLTNSLIRTYGWIVLLRKNGVVNNLLINLGIIDNPISFIYNNIGVIFGMVYTLLPFMILPLFSATDKIDKSVIEASYDLGAGRLETFFKIIIPETKAALFNGSLMVFIPAIGYFFISDLLGGGKLMLLGNLIKNQFLVARNWPLGAAISIVLLIITFALVGIYKRIGGKLDDLGGM